MSINKDRFRALPIKERAALINTYVSGGVMDLKEMKRHYNTLDDGGDTENERKRSGYTTTTKQDLEDVETFNSNWYKYRDKQLADAVRSYYAPQHITRGLSFWQNSFPEFVNDTKLAGGARNYINERLEALKEFTIEEAVKDNQAKQMLIDDYYSYFPNERTENEVEIGPPRIPDNQSLIRLHNLIYKGGYSKPAHLITYSNGYENTSTKIHERAHASIYQDVMGYHSVLKPIRNVVLKQGVNAHKYYDKLTEVYSRLMQLRFENNIDPTHTYTLEEVKAMRNDPNFKDFHIFDRYTDDSILMLLNEVAHNTTDSNRLDYVNPDNIAAYGGRILDGTETEQTTTSESPIKDKARDLAYKIITQKGVSDKGRATIGEIISGVMNENPIVDDNKMMFLYGNVNGLPPASDDIGFDFTQYIQQNYPDRNIQSYKGKINPYNEYVFDEKNKGLIEELAKKGQHIYSNADDEYVQHVQLPHPDTRNNPTAEFMDVGYRDDVHSYPLKFDVDSDGNIVAHAADLYDFNAREYLKEFKPFKALQAHLLTSVGNPYILRQDNTPVKFIDLNGKSDYSPRVNYNGNVYDDDLTDEERRAVNFNWILKNISDEKVADYLGSGYIEPSVVESKKASGGRILDGKTKRMYGGNNDNFRSVAKMNARKLSSKTLK